MFTRVRLAIEKEDEINTSCRKTELPFVSVPIENREMLKSPCAYYLRPAVSEELSVSRQGVSLIKKEKQDIKSKISKGG
jgi:hypothetical protein